MKAHLTRLAIPLFGLLVLTSCEKVPTFQELTGQDTGPEQSAKSPDPSPKNQPTSQPVVNNTPPDNPVVADPSAVLAVIRRESGNLKDEDLIRATNLPTGLAEFKSLNLSRSEVTDDGIRLAAKFPELKKIEISGQTIRGDGLAGLLPLSELRVVVLDQAQIGSPTGWEHIGKLSQVETLSLTATNITDADVALLKPMTSLKELNIVGTGLSDAALIVLAELENLEILHIGHTTNIRGVGFEAFAAGSKMPRLRSLYASHSTLSTEGVRNIKRITSLEFLDLSYSNFTDQLLIELKGMANLRELILQKNNLSVASGPTIRTMNKLKYLDLRENPSVNAQTLSFLSKLSQLEYLNVTATGCTSGSIAEFRRLRKNCELISTVAEELQRDASKRKAP